MIRPALVALLIFAITGPAAAGGPRFVDRAADLPGPPHVYDGGWEHFVGGGVSVLDCNGDSRPDFVAAGGADPTHLYGNTTPAPGADLSFDRSDLNDLRGVTGLWPVDIDGDGVLDLAVMRVGPNVFLKGDGACGFTDATEAWGIPAGDAWSTAFSATWEDEARRPTLAIGNYVDRADPDGPFGACDANTLLRPGPDGYTATPLEPGFCALSILFSDWDRRGAADLRVSNDRHYYVDEGHEQMWRLDPLRRLDTTDGWRDISIWGMGIASRDVTGDGRPDVMLTSMGDQLMQLSTAHGFEDAPWGFGTQAQRPHVGDDGRPSTGWHPEFADVDNDGRSDLFIAKGNVDQMPGLAMRDPNTLLMQQPDGTFAEAAAEAGIATMDRARGGALADLNGDGRLDLIVVNRRAPLELWQNTTPAVGNWVGVDLRQKGGNRFAVGAWVEMRTDAGTALQEVTIGGGHGGGQAGPLHFGIGAAEAAEIRVTWPDGWRSHWIALTANQVVTLTHAPSL